MHAYDYPTHVMILLSRLYDYNIIRVRCMRIEKSIANHIVLDAMKSVPT